MWLRWAIRFGLVALVALTAHSVRVRPAAIEVRAQPGGEAALRDLAERLLAPSLLGPGAEPITARLLPGQVPAGLPVDLPMPEGSRLIGSLVRLTGSETSGATVVIEASGTAASILAFYEQVLTAHGWSTAPFAGPGNPPGGLQPTLLPVSRAYCQSTRGPQMSVTVLPRAAGPSDVRMTLDTLFPYACQALQQPSEADLLPPLYTPPAVELLPSNPPQPITGGKPAL
ncbi:MAG: hypothetical protein ACRDJE_26890, partial [Dehalococcoidia bacterium]